MIHRAGLPALMATLCALAAVAAGATTREVTFGARGHVAGQLDRPDGAGPFPLVVLLPAAGFDRDGTSRDLTALRRIYLPLVKAANDAGWAVFRYDWTRGGPTRKDDVDRALAGIRTALDLPGVDPTRVVLVAHGAGGQVLRTGYPEFEEAIGYRALAGVVLLASDIGPQTGGRMAGDLVVIMSRANMPEAIAEATSAVAVHRRSMPDRRAEVLLLDGSNLALCDTADTAWRGWNGLPGSGRLRVEIGERLGKLLRDIAAETAPPVQAGR